MLAKYLLKNSIQIIIITLKKLQILSFIKKFLFTWLLALFKNFEFFHHVIVAGGLDPWLLHSKRKSCPADSGSLLVRIWTFSGRTEIQKWNWRVINNRINFQYIYFCWITFIVRIFSWVCVDSIISHSGRNDLFCFFFVLFWLGRKVGVMVGIWI